MRMFLRKTALSILAGPFFIFAASATSQDYLTTTLDVQNGLSDNCVNDVLFDSNNFLWVGTNEGLDFYDGVNILHYDVLNPENGRPSVVFSLCEDPSGTLWIGSSNGLYYIRKGAEIATRMEIPELNAVSVRQITCSDDGMLWIARNGSNLIRIDTPTGNVEYLPVAYKIISSDNKGDVYALSDDKHLNELSWNGLNTLVSTRSELRTWIPSRAAIQISPEECSRTSLTFVTNFNDLIVKVFKSTTNGYPSDVDRNSFPDTHRIR